MAPDGIDRKPEPNRIVLLIAEGELANIAVNHLVTHFDHVTILRERPESKWTILRRRGRLVGPLNAVSQAICGILLKLVAKRSRARIDEICASHGLLVRMPANTDHRSIGSVNSELCRRVLKDVDPQVIAVYGTRIISKQTLAAVAAPFINYHAGITPKYRGQHPAYWAQVEGDRDHAGVTIHLVDEGVDTGAVLYQQPVGFSPGDNITTYQYAQMVTALPLFVRAIEDALGARLRPQSVDLPSRKWFPPTLPQYIINGIKHSVW
jgi:folate-dependent phosphoribosylglycinamide formyltransferase PurN